MNKALVSALCATASFFPLSGAIAQSSPESDQNTAASAVAQDVSQAAEEITVTARKRQESFFDVPVVVSILTQDQLERQQVQDLRGLATRVPGLLVTPGNVTTGGNVAIRGIGNSGTNPTMDQSISLNVDGLQLSQSYSYEAAMFDVGVVEVLKGPQALFFGKNSPAGVISIRTADPTDELEIILRGGYEFEANEKLGEAIISGPISDTLKLRLAGRYTSDDGFFKNRTTAPPGFGVRTPTTTKMGVGDNWMLRGTALFEPSDRYEARLKVNFTRDISNFDAGTGQLGYCPNGLVSFTGLPVFDQSDNCKIDRDVYVSWPNKAGFPLVRRDYIYWRSHSKFGTLEQDLHFGEVTLTSVTGYYKYDHSFLTTGSETGGLNPFMADNDFSNRQFTQEVRLTSDFTDGPIDFMLGGFYQDGRQTNHVRLYGDVLLGLPPILMDVIHTVDIKSLSGFGQLIWNVTDQFELAAGARLTNEKRDHTQLNIASLGAPPGLIPLADPRISSTNISPEVTATYQPTDNLTIFGAYKQGFKSGSFNTLIFNAGPAPLSFGDEKVESFEAGLKARFLNRSLNFNLAAYFNKYQGLQVGSIETTPTGGFNLRILNAASAKVKGIEFDMTYLPPQVEGLTLRAGANYNHARYDEFSNAPCGGNQTIAEGCNQAFSVPLNAFTAQDLSGEPLVRAPDWMLNAGFDYEASVGRNMKLRLGSSMNYSSKFYTNLLNVDAPAFVQQGYAKINANIALAGRDEAWEIALIANNITNKITASACANGNLNGALIFGGQQSGQATGGPAGHDYATCQGDRGRAVWIKVTLRPGELMRR